MNALRQNRKAAGRCRLNHIAGGALVCLAAFGTLGCDAVDYVLSLAAGQAEVLCNAVPIESVLSGLAGDELSEEQRAKLELIVAARQFAVEVIGLNAGESYTMFLDTRGQPASYNLSASPPYALEPLSWTFPIVGTIPYLGFFDRRRAEDAQQALLDAGYDTLLYEVDAFSTLGFFPDPVRSAMLARNEISLADTVVHELTHNTIWRPGDADFSESLATFVGRTGGLQFLEERFGHDAPILDEARARFQDTDRYNAFMADLHDALADYYAGPGTNDEKVAGRETVFQAARERFETEVLPTLNRPQGYAWLVNLPTNNAWVLVNRRYNLDLDLFERVFAANGNDWSATLAVFSQAAGQPDAKAFMGQWLLDRGVD